MYHNITWNKVLLFHFIKLSDSSRIWHTAFIAYRDGHTPVISRCCRSAMLFDMLWRRTHGVLFESSPLSTEDSYWYIMVWSSIGFMLPPDFMGNVSPVCSVLLYLGAKVVLLDTVFRNLLMSCPSNTDLEPVYLLWFTFICQCFDNNSYIMLHAMLLFLGRYILISCTILIGLGVIRVFSLPASLGMHFLQSFIVSVLSSVGCYRMKRLRSSSSSDTSDSESESNLNWSVSVFLLFQSVTKSVFV